MIADFTNRVEDMRLQDLAEGDSKELVSQVLPCTADYFVLHSMNELHDIQFVPNGSNIVSLFHSSKAGSHFESYQQLMTSWTVRVQMASNKIYILNVICADINSVGEKPASKEYITASSDTDIDSLQPCWWLVICKSSLCASPKPM